MNKVNIKDFIIEDHVIDGNISYRGGTLKVDVSEIFPEVENAVMGAYQNYLGGGIAGAIIGAAQFDPQELNKADQKKFEALKERIKKYFYDLNSGGGDDYMVENVNSYKQNQSLPTGGY